MGAPPDPPPTEGADPGRERRRSPRQPVPGGRRWYDSPDLIRAFDYTCLNLGGDLHRYRERQGLSQVDAARFADMHAHTVRAMENHDTDPVMSSIVRVAYVYGLLVRVTFHPSRDLPETGVCPLTRPSR
jgi:DNA-binding XRE family transcriptional regulator